VITCPYNGLPVHTFQYGNTGIIFLSDFVLASCRVCTNFILSNKSAALGLCSLNTPALIGFAVG
jgi:hypothetical protein